MNTATLELFEVPTDISRPIQDATNVNLFEKAICLKLDMGCLGSSKKLSSAKIEVDADKDRVKASKTILESKELDAIRASQSAAGAAIRKLCLPSMFKAGIYLLPIRSITAADKLLVEAQQAIMGELVPAFLTVYPQLVENDKVSLRSNWSPTDYSPLPKVQAAFYFDWSYVSFGTPAALESVDSSIFAREQAKAAMRLAEAAEQIQDVLRAQMLELVSHLSDKLDGTRANGKPKIFRDSAVENVREFLETFRNRNITDDKQLDDLCARAKALLEGVDPQTLRDQDVVRDRVRQGFAEIKTKLDGLMVNKPSRMILLDDDSTDAAA